MTKPKVVDVTKNGHSVAPIPTVAAPAVAPDLPPGSPALEEARAVIELERQARAQACLAEISQVLERYGCTLISQTLIQAR